MASTGSVTPYRMYCRGLADAITALRAGRYISHADAAQVARFYVDAAADTFCSDLEPVDLTDALTAFDHLLIGEPR